MSSLDKGPFWPAAAPAGAATVAMPGAVAASSDAAAGWGAAARVAAGGASELAAKGSAGVGAAAARGAGGAGAPAALPLLLWRCRLPLATLAGAGGCCTRKGSKTSAGAGTGAGADGALLPPKGSQLPAAALVAAPGATADGAGAAGAGGGVANASQAGCAAGASAGIGAGSSKLSKSKLGAGGSGCLGAAAGAGTPTASLAGAGAGASGAAAAGWAACSWPPAAPPSAAVCCTMNCRPDSEGRAKSQQSQQLQRRHCHRSLGSIAALFQPRQPKPAGPQRAAASAMLHAQTSMPMPLRRTGWVA